MCFVGDDLIKVLDPVIVDPNLHPDDILDKKPDPDSSIKKNGPVSGSHHRITIFFDFSILMDFKSDCSDWIRIRQKRLDLNPSNTPGFGADKNTRIWIRQKRPALDP